MVLKYGTACDSRIADVLSIQPESLPDVETIHNRLPSMRATGLTMLIPTVELTLELSAEWWTSPMPFSMTIRWPTQGDSAVVVATACPTMSAGESSPVAASRKREKLFTQRARARTAIAIAPIAITTAKVVADKTQIIPILPMNAIIATKRKKPAP